MTLPPLPAIVERAAHHYVGEGLENAVRAYGEACAAAERERIAASFDIPLAITGEAEEWCRAAARSIRAGSKP